MPRLARAVVPGLPHHITQRGNRRQRTFFGLDDYLRYLALMAESCDSEHVKIWAYCLMPNHVHLIAVPPSEQALAHAIGEAHRQYSAEVNRREHWRGYLWQGRFSSYVMDERYTLAAARYIELNPVRAGLVTHADQYPWSSARAHVLARDDGLVDTEPLLTRVPDWTGFLRDSAPDHELERLRAHQTTGRPLGTEEFIDGVEHALGRILRPLPPGRHPRPDYREAELALAEWELAR